MAENDETTAHRTTMRVLNDTSVVDDSCVTAEGRVRLVAFTYGPLVDTPEIRKAVAAKLLTYLDYTLQASFRETYGAERPAEIIFRCTAEPEQPVLTAALDAGMAWCARTGINIPVYWTWHEGRGERRAGGTTGHDEAGRPTRA